MGSAHVLIADDDATLVQTMTWVLKEHGYDVTATREGRRVIPLMSERMPDIVLLDVMFPDTDGNVILERIKAEDKWRDIPILMISSLPPEEAAVRTLGLGAADYVRKPFRVRELLARIQAQLRMRASLNSTHESMKQMQETLYRVQEEAEHRRQLVDILHDVTDELSADEIYHLLARRVARALDLTHCSVILAMEGESPRVVATAYETGVGRDFVLDLDRYPELRAALGTRRPVLVEDVATSPLYEQVRRTWAAEGREVSTRSVIAIPFSLEPQQAGIFFLRRSLHEPPLTRIDVEFADTVIRAAVTAVQRAKVLETTIADNRRLELLAQTDPLTKVLNRRALNERLTSEMERVRRYASVLSVLLIDLDHFKQINDTHGHLTGDDVLVEVASLLQHTVRAVDVVARYGGEEFVVVLPETGPAGAAAFAERLRELIESYAFAEARGGGPPVRMTTSIGVASYPGFGSESVDDLLATSDQALYRAKAEGRNRVRA
jgi:two-component system cell cycle response regulator